MNVSANAAPQNETTISHKPASTKLLVAGANDYRLGDASAGYYFSIDGGRNWTQAVLPRLGYEAAGDPAARYGRLNRVHYSYLAFNRTAPGANAVVVATLDGSAAPSVDDKGVVSGATTVVVVSSATDNPFHDKPYLAVDPSSGNVYVTWTQFNSNPDGTFNSAIINFARSTNGGTFSAPVAISGTLAASQGSVPVVAPDGTLYVVWQDFGAGRHVFARSSDGGNTFTPPATVSSVSNLPSPLPGSRFRTNSFPTAAVGADGTLYVAWANWETWTVAGQNANIRLTWSTNGGTNWSGGGNWANATLLNTVIQADQFFPWIAGVDSTTGNLHAVFYDRRDDKNNKKFHTYRAVFNRTTISLSNFRVTEVASDPSNDGFGGKFIGDYIGATFNGNPVGAWTDMRTGNAEVFTDPDG